MGHKIFIFMGIATIELLICSSLVFGLMEGEIYQVDILHDEQGWHIEPCPLPGGEGHTWRILNTTADSLCVFILNREGGWPHTVVETTYTLATDTSVDHPVDSDDWAIAVKLGLCGGELSFLAACSFSPASHPPHNVTIKENEEWEIQPCPLPVDSQWVFYDSTSSLIFIWIMYPVQTTSEPQPYAIVPGWGYLNVPVYEWGGVQVSVFNLDHSQMLAYCRNPGGPMLTPWGIIVLLILLIVSTAFILKREKQTT